MRIPMLALICLIATGCGQGAAASGVPPEEARPSAASVPLAASTPVGGGTAAQRALLRQILRGMGPTSISEIRIVPAPRGSGYRLDPGAVELDMDLRGKEGGLHAEWQGWLVAGAFRDRSAAAGLPEAALLAVPGLEMDVAKETKVDDPLSARSAAAVVRAAARRAGAAVMTLAVVHPDEAVGVDVVLQTSEPAWFLKHRVTRFLNGTARLFGRLDGMSLRVVDADGTIVLQAANFTRLAISGNGVAPEFAGCDPFVHRGGAVSDPPPCPVGGHR